MQYLLTALIIYLIYIIYFKKPALSAEKKREPKDRPFKKKQAKKEEPQADEMIECATCGTFASLDEMIIADGKYFCSQQCLEKAS